MALRRQLHTPVRQDSIQMRGNISNRNRGRQSNREARIIKTTCDIGPSLLFYIADLSSNGTRAQLRLRQARAAAWRTQARIFSPNSAMNAKSASSCTGFAT